MIGLLELIQVVSVWIYYQELLWGNSYLWEHNVEITWTFYIGLFQKLSQHEEVLDILFLILLVKVLLREQHKYCLNLI